MGISPGWRKADDEWERRITEHWAKERENRIRKVGDKQCVVGQRPALYISAESEEFVAYITAPDGHRVPLICGAKGEVIIPTPFAIEEKKANGEGRKPGAN